MIYQAPRLASIQEIRPEDIYPTGEVPVRVRASDRALYVTKPCRATGDHGVVREFLAAHFLKIWGLDVPDFAVITVKEEHLPGFLHQRLQRYHFQRSAFGSRLRVGVDHVQRLMHHAANYQIKLTDLQGELLQIALFDLWLKNDDRNENNANLLYNTTAPHRFIPIDHGALFDYGRPGETLSLQTIGDSILSSSVGAVFISRKDRQIYAANPQSKIDFFDRVRLVDRYLERVVDDLPQEWMVGLPSLTTDLRATIFVESWLEEVWATFMEYLQITR